jgi:hypothetical protein
MDTAFWQQQWNAFVSAPVVSIFFLVIGAGAAWWFRGATMSGERDGLKARIDALEERLRLAADKLAEREESKSRLENDLKRLREQIEAGASTKDIATTAASANAQLGIIGEQDDWLRSHLAPPDPWADSDAASKALPLEDTGLRNILETPPKRRPRDLHIHIHDTNKKK